VLGPGAAPVLASEGRPGSWGRPRRGKGVRAVAVRWKRRRGPGVRPRVREGPANRALWANRGGVPSMAPPAPPTWGAVLRAPPPVGCHSGGVARRAGLRGAGVGTLVRLAEPHKKGGDRRGTDGAAVHYRPSPSPPTATRTGSPPLVPLCAVRPPLQCHPPRRPPYQSAAAMASSRSTAEAPTEEMASPRAGRTTPAPSGTPASATAK